MNLNLSEEIKTRRKKGQKNIFFPVGTMNDDQEKIMENINGKTKFFSLFFLFTRK